MSPNREINPHCIYLIKLCCTFTSNIQQQKNMMTNEFIRLASSAVLFLVAWQKITDMYVDGDALLLFSFNFNIFVCAIRIARTRLVDQSISTSAQERF